MTSTTAATAALDLDRLEALARAATPGPWDVNQASSMKNGRIVVDELYIYSPEARNVAIAADIADPATGEMSEANANFIAAANPATILALIDLARRPQPIASSGAAGAGSEQDERVAFEKAFPHHKFMRAPDGYYAYVETQAAWDAWQARAAHAHGASSAPAGTAHAAAGAIVRDVRELDYTGEHDEEKMLAVAVDDLRLICERHIGTATPASAQPAEAHSDDLAVDRFAAEMKNKMAKARAKGRAGWDDPAACSAARLQIMLVEHLAKGDPVDIGNFAMMLWNRGEAAAEASAQPVAAAPAEQAARMIEQALIEVDEIADARPQRYADENRMRLERRPINMKDAKPKARRAAKLLREAWELLEPSQIDTAPAALVAQADILAKARELLHDAAEPDATQEKAEIGMVAQWDVDALALIDRIDAALATPAAEVAQATPASAGEKAARPSMLYETAKLLLDRYDELRATKGAPTAVEFDLLRHALAGDAATIPSGASAGADARDAALEEAAQTAITRTAVPRDVLGPATAAMKSRAHTGEIVAAAIRAMKGRAAAQGGAK